MAPPADLPRISSGAPGPQQTAAPPPSRDAAGGQGGAAATRAPSPDLADIRPLDVRGALQILVAEVRDALEEALLAALRSPAPAAVARSPAMSAAPAGAPVAADTPEQAAHAVLESVLQLQSASDAEPQPGAAAPQNVLDSVVQSGLQRATDIVAGWQGVAAAAPEAAHAAAQLIMNALGENALNSVWLRPEWAQFLPRLERYRRRRARQRRRLTDPDYRDGGPADEERR